MPTHTPPGMFRIAGGRFRMGTDFSYPEEGPVHDVTVEGFWIDARAVTNADFAEFVAAAGYATVADRDYQVPYKFTGKIDKLTISLEPPKLSAADEKQLREAYEKAQDQR